MLKPTLENILDFASIHNIDKDWAESYFLGQAAVDWKDGCNRDIINWQYHIKKLWVNGIKFKAETRKCKLYPISGKMCGEKGCGMPAIYKKSGNFDWYYCAEHMPAKVKEKYE